MNMQMCKIMDSISWLYLRGFIEDVERDRLLVATEKEFAKQNNEVKKE